MKKKSLLQKLGPGFITGASDDDPSGIATYAQTGAIFGYAQLWMALWTLPFMIAVQEMCGRIGLVTGTGLSGVIRRHYSRKLLFAAVFLLLIANTINIGADLGAMAAAGQLLVPVPFTVLLLSMTAVTLLLEIFITYRTYATYLTYLAFSLVAYVLVAFVVEQDWAAIVTQTLIPHVAFTREYLMNIVAFLGTTISPYLFFWQAGEEVEEEVASGRLTAMGHGTPVIDDRDVRAMQADTALGMFFSNFVTFFIITTTASTLHVGGIFRIQTAADAAEALRPLAGDFASVLFALGIVGTGLLSVPILAGSTAYALAETFGWQYGLHHKLHQAYAFYGVIIISMLVGVIANFAHLDPIKGLIYAAVANGIISPVILFFVVRLSSDKKIMGEYANRALVRLMGWTTIIAMALSGAAAILTFWW